jgi:hypothetical protein
MTSCLAIRLKFWHFEALIFGAFDSGLSKAAGAEAKPSNRETRRAREAQGAGGVTAAAYRDRGAVRSA